MLLAGCEEYQISIVRNELSGREPDPGGPQLPHEGAGMFVRATHHYPEYADQHLAWASICVLSGGRPRSRSTEFWAKRREAGVVLSAWDWFPNPDKPTKGLADAIKFAAEQGAVSFILNAEKAFRGRPEAAREYASAARAACDEHGLALGFSSYSKPYTVKDFPWDEFSEHCDFGVPQIYDRENEFDPDYPSEAIQAWRAVGFDLVLPACGIYYGVKPTRKGEKWKWYWRKAYMVTRHLHLFPEPLIAWLAWPLAGRPPGATLEALGRGRP